MTPPTWALMDTVSMGSTEPTAFRDRGSGWIVTRATVTGTGGMGTAFLPEQPPASMPDEQPLPGWRRRADAVRPGSFSDV